MSIEFTLRSEATSTVLRTFNNKLCSYIFWIKYAINVTNVWEHPIYSVVEDRESEFSLEYEVRKQILRRKRSGLRLRLRFAGEFTARVPPVPIPNTEVKPRWADGTARVSVWEIR